MRIPSFHIRPLILSALLLILLFNNLFSQANYESNTVNGDWDSPASWVLAVGSPADGDGDGIPDANDNVNILPGEQINIQPAGTTSVDDLTIQGTLNFPSNGITLNVGGNLLMSGSSAVTGNNVARVLNVAGAFNVSSGATATLNGQTINILGLTTIDGSLLFANTNGDKTFQNIDVNASGVWDNGTVSESFTITGNITNDGTWNGCSNNNCLYTLTAVGGLISGGSTVNFADVSISNSITNNGSVYISDDFLGTGSFTNGATGSLEVNGGGPISITTIDLSAVGNTVTFSGPGNLAVPSTTFYNLVISKTGTARADVTSNITINNDLIINSGEFRMNGGTLSFNNITIQGGEFSPNNAAVTATVSGDVTITSGNFDFNNGSVTVSGDLLVQGGTLNDVNGGTLSVNNLVVNNGQTLELGGSTFTANGSTTLNGTLTVDGNGGDKTFNNIVVNGTGNWNVASTESFTVNGDITANGSWTNCSNVNGCVYTLTNTSGTIASNSPISFSDILINTPASYTNTTDLTITDELIGTGTFTQANGASLTLDGAGPFSITSLVASTVTNTVTFSGAGSGNINPTDYYALTINKTGTNSMTVAGPTTVATDLVVSAGVMVVDASLDVTNDVLIQGGEFSPDDVAAVIDIGGDLTITSGLYDQNNGTITVAGDLLVQGGTLNDINGGSISVNNLTINVGQTLELGNGSLTVANSSVINGTLTTDAGGGTNTFNDITVSATGNWNVTSQPSFTINGSIDANGTWTGCSSATGCVYTLTNTSGTIASTSPISFSDVVINNPASYTNTADMTITDELIGTGSFTNANGALLTLDGAGPFSVSTFDASAAINTVTYTGASNPTLNSGLYYNLIVNKSAGNITISSATTVSNDLTIQQGVLLVNAATLAVTNNVLISGGEFSPNDAAAIVNVGGNLSMTSGLYDQNNGDVNIIGNLTINGGDLTLDGASSTFDVDGTFQMSGGTSDFNAGAFTSQTLLIDAGDIVTLSNANFTISGTSTINGTLTTDAGGGTNTFNDITVSATGNWNVTTNADFNINGDITSNGAWSGCLANGCDYTLASTSGVLSGSAAIDMSDIIITSPASYTNQTSITASDRITGTGTLINDVNSNLTFSGTQFDLVNFTASATGNTVTYSVPGDEDLIVTTDNSFYNLVINNGIGDDLTMVSSQTILNQLTLTVGDLILGTNRLTLGDGATILNGNEDSFIRINSSGVVRQNYSAAGATLSFPIGDNDDYSPINSLTINSATFGASPYLDLTITDAAQPNRNVDNTALGGDDDGTTAVDYISRYWTLTPNDISNVTFSATYTYVDADVIGTEANMIGSVYRTPIGEAFMDWSVEEAVNATNNLVTVTNVESVAFGDLYAMNNTLERLPVQLVSFQGKFKDSSVLLTWITSSEINNSYFSIERSSDGIEFQSIAYVEGSGTTNDSQVYQFEDEFPFEGRSYYRLKQTDFNGQFEYSEVISVVLRDKEDTTEMIRVSTNRVNNNGAVKIEINGAELETKTLSIRIIDLKGVSVLSMIVQANQTHTISVPFLAKGIYILQVVSSDFKATKKILVE